MPTADMSPAAITGRLQQTDELRALCLALAGPRLKRPWGVPELPPPPATVHEPAAEYPTTSAKLR